MRRYYTLWKMVHVVQVESFLGRRRSVAGKVPRKLLSDRDPYCMYPIDKESPNDCDDALGDAADLRSIHEGLHHVLDHAVLRCY